MMKIVAIKVLLEFQAQCSRVVIRTLLRYSPTLLPRGLRVRQNMENRNRFLPYFQIRGDFHADLFHFNVTAKLCEFLHRF